MSKRTKSSGKKGEFPHLKGNNVITKYTVPASPRRIFSTKHRKEHRKESSFANSSRSSARSGSDVIVISDSEDEAESASTSRMTRSQKSGKTPSHKLSETTATGSRAKVPMRSGFHAGETHLVKDSRRHKVTTQTHLPSSSKTLKPPQKVIKASPAVPSISMASEKIFQSRIKLSMMTSILPQTQTTKAPVATSKPPKAPISIESTPRLKSTQESKRSIVPVAQSTPKPASKFDNTALSKQISAQSIDNQKIMAKYSRMLRSQKAMSPPEPRRHEREKLFRSTPHKDRAGIPFPRLADCHAGQKEDKESFHQDANRDFRHLEYIRKMTGRRHLYDDPRIQSTDAVRPPPQRETERSRDNELVQKWLESSNFSVDTCEGEKYETEIDKSGRTHTNSVKDTAQTSTSHKPRSSNTAGTEKSTRDRAKNVHAPADQAHTGIPQREGSKTVSSSNGNNAKSSQGSFVPDSVIHDLLAECLLKPQKSSKVFTDVSNNSSKTNSSPPEILTGSSKSKHPKSTSSNSSENSPTFVPKLKKLTMPSDSSSGDTAKISQSSERVPKSQPERWHSDLENDPKDTLSDFVAKKKSQQTRTHVSQERKNLTQSSATLDSQDSSVKHKQSESSPSLSPVLNPSSQNRGGRGISLGQESSQASVDFLDKGYEVSPVLKSAFGAFRKRGMKDDNLEERPASKRIKTSLDVEREDRKMNTLLDSILSEAKKKTREKRLAALGSPASRRSLFTSMGSSTSLHRSVLKQQPDHPLNRMLKASPTNQRNRVLKVEESKHVIPWRSPIKTSPKSQGTAITYPPSMTSSQESLQSHGGDSPASKHSTGIWRTKLRLEAYRSKQFNPISSPESISMSPRKPSRALLLSQAMPRRQKLVVLKPSENEYNIEVMESAKPDSESSQSSGEVSITAKASSSAAAESPVVTMATTSSTVSSQSDAKNSDITMVTPSVTLQTITELSTYPNAASVMSQSRANKDKVLKTTVPTPTPSQSESESAGISSTHPANTESDEGVGDSGTDAVTRLLELMEEAEENDRRTATTGGEITSSETEKMDSADLDTEIQDNVVTSEEVVAAVAETTAHDICPEKKQASEAQSEQSVAGALPSDFNSNTTQQKPPYSVNEAPNRSESSLIHSAETSSIPILEESSPNPVTLEVRCMKVNEDSMQSGDVLKTMASEAVAAESAAESQTTDLPSDTMKHDSDATTCLPDSRGFAQNLDAIVENNDRADELDKQSLNFENTGEPGSKSEENHSTVMQGSKLDEPKFSMFDISQFFEDDDMPDQLSDSEIAIGDYLPEVLCEDTITALRRRQSETDGSDKDRNKLDEDLDELPVLTETPRVKRRRLTNENANQKPTLADSEKMMSQLLERTFSPRSRSHESLMDSDWMKELNDITSTDPNRQRNSRKRLRNSDHSLTLKNEPSFTAILADTAFSRSYKIHGASLKKLVREKKRDNELDKMEKILLSDLKKGGFRRTLEQAEHGGTGANVECDEDTKRAINLMKKDWGTLPILSSSANIIKSKKIRHCIHTLELKSYFDTFSLAAMTLRLRTTVLKLSAPVMFKQVGYLNFLLNQSSTRMQTYKFLLDVLHCHERSDMVQVILRSNLRSQRFKKPPYTFPQFITALVNTGVSQNMFTGHYSNQETESDQPPKSSVCEKCLGRRCKTSVNNVANITKIFSLTCHLHAEFLHTTSERAESAVFLLLLLQERNLRHTDVMEMIKDLFREITNWDSVKYLITQRLIELCSKLNALQSIAMRLHSNGERPHELSRILSFALLKLHIFGLEPQASKMDNYNDLDELLEIVEHFSPENLEVLLVPEKSEEQIGSQKRSYYHLSLLLPMFNICIGNKCEDNATFVTLDRIWSLLRTMNKRIRDNGAIYRSQVKYELSLFTKNLRLLIQKAPKSNKASIFKYLRSAPVKEEMVNTSMEQSASSSDSDDVDVTYGEDDDEEGRGQRSTRSASEIGDEFQIAEVIKSRIIGSAGKD